MEVEEFEETNGELKKNIGALCKSEEFDTDLMKKIKNICKQNDRNVRLAKKFVFVQLGRNHCVVRLNCVHIIDQLFQRSNCFRNLVLDDFQTLVDLSLGCDPSKPLPPPASQHKKIRKESIKKIKEWHDKFGDGYKKLRLSFNFLKQIIDFDEQCLVNDEDRLKRIARREKLERIWAERMRQVSSEVSEYDEDIVNWFNRTKNIFDALSNNGSSATEFSEEIKGQYKILTRRLLPKTKAWIVTLTKAGNSTDHDLMRRVIEIKNLLSQELLKFESFNIPFDLIATEEVKQEIVDEKMTKKIVDPTTWEATVKKVTGKDIKLNLEFKDPEIRNNSVDCDDSSPSCSGSSSKVPKIRLEDLKEPDSMVVDPEKSRFWVSDHREGQVMSIGCTQRVAEFNEKSIPVKWSCRAKLTSGNLCPRMDRIKCPLHGIIVARDKNGEAVEKVEKKIHFESELKSRKKNKGMKSATKWDETSRSRIEHKIFSKSSVKRVARDLRKYDAIRTKDKFVDQFNY